MNKILRTDNKNKKIIVVVIILIILAIIYFLINKQQKNQKNSYIYEASLEEKLIEEKLNKREKMDIRGPMLSNLQIDNEDEITIYPDNTVNLQDFGAIGNSFYYNDVDNQYYEDEEFRNIEIVNSKALQECLDFAERNNCNVKIPKGTYCIEQRILIPDNIEIIGEDGAVFLIYDKFENKSDDFVFRNKNVDTSGIIKIKNVDFKLESHKSEEFPTNGRHILKFYNLNEVDIEECDISIENKGTTNSYTPIDARGSFKKINISNCEIQNQNQSAEGGGIWIRADKVDAIIDEIIIENNKLIRNGNDELIGIWGKGEFKKICVKNNEIIYSNNSNATNDILISCNTSDSTGKINEFNFTENNIKIDGMCKGVIGLTNNKANIYDVNILKNRIEYNSQYEDSFGGIIKVSNGNLENQESLNINIKENTIDTSKSLACRQIVNLRNANANIESNEINAKTTYGIIFIDNNSEKSIINLNKNNITSASSKNDQILLNTKDVNIDFIAKDNNITGYADIVYIAPENSQYEYQINAKQNITLENNKFKNITWILQNSRNNNIENFIVDRNEFEKINEVMYESGEKGIFNGDIEIKDNCFFDEKNSDKIMNILKTDLSNTDSVDTNTNYFINTNTEQVVGNIIDKYNEFEKKYEEDISDYKDIVNNLKTNIENIATNENKEILLDDLNNIYSLGVTLINDNKNEEILKDLDEISQLYTNLIVIYKLNKPDIETKNLTTLQELIDKNSDLDIEYAKILLQQCKAYQNEIENINEYEDGKTKDSLLTCKKLYLYNNANWAEKLVNIQLDKYLSENPLTISYEPSKDSWTSNDVIATVDIRDDTQITNNENSNKYTFTNNDSFTFEYERRGRNGKIVANVDNIDKIAPVIEGIEEGKIYDDKVILKVSDKNLSEVTLTLNGETIEYNYNIELTEEGVYNVFARDLAGNTNTVNFTIISKQSTEYEIKDNVIRNISNNTPINTFKEKLNINTNYVIYRDDKPLSKDAIIATGDVLKINDTKTYSLIVTGDINKDGKVNIKDLVRMRKYLLVKNSLDDVEKLAADCNLDDQELSIKDMVRMRVIILTQN